MGKGGKAAGLEELYEAIRGDPDYRTESMGSMFVPGKGALEGDLIVFIGEAPGRVEELKRSPFVGPAGKNLTELLQRVGLSRDRVYITNIVKYRPTTPKGDNRSPTVVEARRALPYLLRELEILAPRLVVCLGLSSARALLENPGIKMGEANGVFFEKHGLKILVTYHPSPYNYRVPGIRALMEEAFEVLAEAYRGT